MVTDADPETPRTPSRRAVIRRAAAAGALAWTAPAIIDSLASPAAAASLSGCFRALFLRTGGTTCGGYIYTRVTAVDGAGCSPSFWNGVADYPGTDVIVTPTVPTGGGACIYRVTISSSSGCVLDIRSVARQDMGNQCQSGTRVGGCHELDFAPAFVPDRFKVVIACGGKVCTGGLSCP
jgi:hypothetical protein